jgi:hypothetical protein
VLQSIGNRKDITDAQLTIKRYALYWGRKVSWTLRRKRWESETNREKKVLEDR